MHVPEWLVATFDMKIDNKGYKSDLENERIDMRMDLETKALFKSKNLAEYWSNINTATEYPKLRVVADPLLLAFPTSYMVETGYGHVNAILTNERNRLNRQNRGDFRILLTNYQPNINNLATAHQARPSHYCQLIYYKGVLTHFFILAIFS